MTRQQTDPQHIRDQFGARLREARLELGWSQAEFADDVGVTPSTISNWECGVSLPRGVMLFHLSKWLGISVDWLFGNATKAQHEKARARFASSRA